MSRYIVLPIARVVTRLGSTGTSFSSLVILLADGALESGAKKNTSVLFIHIIAVLVL